MACPVCNKPSVPAYTPFCCKRCADVDLGRWMTERYTVEGKAHEESDSEDAANDNTPPDDR